MEQLLKFIIDQTAQGKIEKETAIQIVKQVKQQDIRETDDIAIIGMSGKLPLADTLDDYWQNIQAGVDCITTFPDTRSEDIVRYLRAVGTPEADIRFNENGFLEEVDKFDYKFFRLSLKEASLMDPHQRLFLETAWSALEDAGYGGQKAVGSNTGVYVGFASSLRDLYLKQIYEVDPNALPLSMVGNLAAVLPSRISYLLDLRGPTMVIDTACSSSLVAVNLAAEALRNGKCDMAIAGGVKINLLPLNHELMKIGIESKDGRTRAFNDDSDGAGIGEGVVAIVLKPLKKALRDGDPIHAVIKGVAMNQDGNSAGLTAPNPASQTDVIVQAWQDARIEPETVSYIETHGTGTKLGDPIEIKGIQDAFRRYTDKSQFCAVGSLKTNVGHASEPAGLMSLIKTVLALRNKQLPPSLYFDKPNRAIRFNESPVYVNTALRAWEPTGEGPRRCGVSSFGISGTNCHVVLEEAPAVATRRPADATTHLLTLSAKSEAALQQVIANYVAYLHDHPEADVANICYSTNTGRGHYTHRVALLVHSRDELLAQLEHPQVLAQATVHKVGSTQGPNPDPGLLSEQDKVLLDRQAARLLETRTADASWWSELQALYLRGADLDWDALYDKKTHARLHLPTYPFERTRCWMDIPETVVTEHEESEDRYYSVLWQSTAPDFTSDTNAREKTVLVFKDERGLWSQLADALRAQCDQLLFVEYGDAYARLNEQTYQVSGTEADFDQLLATLPAGSLSRIIHLASITAEDTVTSFAALCETQKRGVDTLFHLLRAMVKRGFDQQIGLTLIGQNTLAVTGEETVLRPEAASLYGIGKAINHEHPGLRIRAIELDEAFDVTEVLHQMYDPSETYMVAYRNGVRYAEQFSEIALEDVPGQEMAIRADGVYLLTGGLGGIGLELAKHFAKQQRIRLALLNRTAMPPRSEWDAIVDAGTDEKLCQRIHAIRAMEANGTEVTCYAANTADESAMREVLTDIRTRYGRLDGIIHGAGIPGDGFLFTKTQDAYDGVLAPKIYGTWVLDHLTQADNLDFVVYFSSGLSILSEPGHGDYTAANSYLDAHAAYRNKLGRPTLAINWTTWKETGMAVDYGFNYDTFFKANTTEQALQGLEAVLGKQLDRVLIGEFSYLPQFLMLIDRLPFQLSDKIRRKCERALSTRPGGVKKDTRPAKAGGKVELTGKDGDSFSDVEQKVAQIYNEILGFAEINIYDNFFELGGDSVMLNRMLALLEEEFPGQVKLIDLFNHTSVATLSQYITAKFEPAPEAQAPAAARNVDDYADLLDEMESGTLSIDDIIKNWT